MLLFSSTVSFNLRNVIPIKVEYKKTLHTYTACLTYVHKAEVSTRKHLKLAFHMVLKQTFNNLFKDVYATHSAGGNIKRAKCLVLALKGGTPWISWEKWVYRPW